MNNHEYLYKYIHQIDYAYNKIKMTGSKMTDISHNNIHYFYNNLCEMDDVRYMQIGSLHL